jgi:hypothetical protein
MANCNKLFIDFGKIITPSLAQMQKMKTSREALEKKISEKIKEKLGVDVSYLTQGSAAHKMKTIIIKENGTYDVDRGVYLPGKPNVSADAVQKYVFDAVSDHTSDGAEHRKKCIRVFYKGAYNIDFPVYYEVEDESYSYIAIKGNGWIKDDPSKMIEWFLDFKDEDGQLLRIVKYLKAWASKASCKMPSGIALTVWAARNFSPISDRDDECLLQLLKQLESVILVSPSCISPVEPFDDFTSKLSESQKEEFSSRLTAFSKDAQNAINEENQLTASKIWKRYLGDRFPEGVDENIDKRANALFSSAASILSNSAHLDKHGFINEKEGVKHQNHRNYAG